MLPIQEQRDQKLKMHLHGRDHLNVHDIPTIPRVTSKNTTVRARPKRFKYHGIFVE